MAKVDIYTQQELEALGWSFSLDINSCEVSKTIAGEIPDVYTYYDAESTADAALWDCQMWATAIEAQLALERLGYRPDVPFLVSEILLYINREQLKLIEARVGGDAIQKAFADAVPELVRRLGNRYDIAAILADNDLSDDKKVSSRKEVVRMLKWLTIKNLYGQHEVLPQTVFINVRRNDEDIRSLHISSGWCHPDYIIAQTDPRTDGFGSTSRATANVFENNEY